jgi:hypothetical protein
MATAAVPKATPTTTAAAATPAGAPTTATAATGESKRVTDEKQYLTGRTWCFDPHYWNGTGWASSKGVALNKYLEKKDLIVLSYNIWFGQFQQVITPHVT